ncbi:DNA-entry nuclease [Paenibacillus sp. MBLB4367]|uniref:NucA/NucB deoxyribonuclease domain-containing protein n=1 Tax=Paenibacillus sp. MBLB4367 TaxID=3384767 RepID=UPI003907F524
MKKKHFIVVALFLLAVAFYLFNQGVFDSLLHRKNDSAAYTLVIPSERFPETAAHIRAAIKRGESRICTIDRGGAEENRKESLKGIPTKPNYDRDEYPMAMCAEGGKGADIAYVAPSDNRGAGSWVSNQLEKFPDGTKIEIKVK